MNIIKNQDDLGATSKCKASALFNYVSRRNFKSEHLVEPNYYASKSTGPPTHRSYSSFVRGAPTRKSNARQD